MSNKELIRTLALSGFCLMLPIYNWHYIIAPSHRTMTLLVLSILISGAVFYELTMRNAPTGWVLAGVTGVMAAAAMTWVALQLLSMPIPNDHTPLLAARDPSVATDCRTAPKALQVILGGTRVTGLGDGPFRPFRVWTCAGPSITRTPRGLLVNASGYDGEGNLIYRIRNDEFEQIQGDDLHLHRTDHSTLALYDKWESEVLFLRYLNENTVRIRGRFLCGETRPVTIQNDEITIGLSRALPPACINLKPGTAPDFSVQTH